MQEKRIQLHTLSHKDYRSPRRFSPRTYICGISIVLSATYICGTCTARRTRTIHHTVTEIRDEFPDKHIMRHIQCFPHSLHLRHRSFTTAGVHDRVHEQPFWNLHRWLAHRECPPLWRSTESQANRPSSVSLGRLELLAA